MEKLAKSLNDNRSENPDDDWMEIPANIPSLCRYYRCLPKEIQDHPGIKDIYLGMEYTSPDFSYE